MSEKKEKVVSYRRAEWFNSDPTSISLGGCIKQTANKLKNIEERSIERPNGQLMRIVNLKQSGGGIYLHITTETPGESASVVPQAPSNQEIDVATTAPPTETEFMDGDAFVYVKDNDVCMCATGVHDASIRRFFQDLFQSAQLRQDATQFDLMKVSDVNKIALLQSQGVK